MKPEDIARAAVGERWAGLYSNEKRLFMHISAAAYALGLEAGAAALEALAARPHEIDLDHVQAVLQAAEHLRTMAKEVSS